MRTTKRAAPSSPATFVQRLELQIEKAGSVYLQTKTPFDAGWVAGLREACTLARMFGDEPSPDSR
jgi:hypothetical protein